MFIKILNQILRIIMVVGVIISFGNLKGWFLNKNRLEMCNYLTSKTRDYRISLNHPATKEFLSKFYFSKNPPLNMREMEIKGLMLKWVSISGNPPMSGGVCVEFVNGKTSTSLCTLDELKRWANENPFYSWLGWWLLAISVSAKILLEIVIYFTKKSRPT